MPDRKPEGSHRNADKTTARVREEAYANALKKYNDRHRIVDAALKDLEYGFEKARVTTQVLGTAHFQIKQAKKATEEFHDVGVEVGKAHHNRDKLKGLSNADEAALRNREGGVSSVGSLLDARDSFETAIAKLQDSPAVISELTRMAEVQVDENLTQFTQDARRVLETQNFEHSSGAERIWRRAWKCQLEINHQYDPKQNRRLRERIKQLDGGRTQEHNMEKLEADAKELKLIQAEVRRCTPESRKLERLERDFQKAMTDMKDLRHTVQAQLQ